MTTSGTPRRNQIGERKIALKILGQRARETTSTTEAKKPTQVPVTAISKVSKVAAINALRGRFGLRETLETSAPKTSKLTPL
jgi:hypothetical protein